MDRPAHRGLGDPDRTVTIGHPARPNNPRGLLLNTRFLTRPQSGVERVGHCLSAALIAEIRARYGQGLSLAQLHPPRRPLLQSVALPARPSLPLSGHLWEQIGLPLAARGEVLLNLCNTGPLWWRDQAIMLHDAQIYDCPDSYSWRFRQAYRLMLPRLGHNAKLVLTVSDYAKSRLEHHDVVPQGKAVTLYNGADHMLAVPEDRRILSRLGLSEGGFVLSIGSLAPHKNLALLVRLMHEMPDPGWPLVVVGKAADGVFAPAELPQGTGRIIMTGAITDAELRALYGAARCLAHPARSEGFGLPPLEAMICGCPVVVSNMAALPEICGNAALYADPDAPQSWWEALSALFSDPALHQSMAHHCRRHAHRFQWQNSAAKLADLLTQHWPTLFQEL